MEENRENKSKFKDSILGITAILGIICVVTALVLALMNSATAPVIDQKFADEKQKAVAELFGGGIEIEYADFDFAAPVREAAVIRDKSSQKLTGYCVTVAPQGIAGQIVMLVAVNPDITVKGTKIISMSETSGIGTKIESEEWFGSQFKYKEKDIKDSKTEPPGGDNAIKTIAGATVSSKAFLSGVNAALDIADKISRQTAVTAESQTTDATEEQAAESQAATKTEEASAEDNSEEDLTDLTDLTEEVSDDEQ